MKKVLMAVCLVMVAFLVKAEDVKEGVKEGMLIFKGTFEEALAKAKAENKLVFVDYYTTW